jgi:hypothetical protein
MNLGMSKLVSGQDMLSVVYASLLAQHAENAGPIQMKIVMCGIAQKLVVLKRVMMRRRQEH